MTDSIETILTERGNRYGTFVAHSRISQNLEDVMRTSPNWELLPCDMKEALKMVGHKVARILNGDFNYVDSWTDIIGYAKLVEDRLNGTTR